MPSDVDVRRFSGLNTVSPNAEGEISELIKAENVVFDDSGLLKSRDAFHLFSNTAGTTEILLMYLGTFSLFGQWIFGSESAYYTWKGDKDSPSLTRYSIAVTASSRDAGNVVTLTVASGHGVVANDQIFVDLTDNTYDGGPFTVTSVTATTIVYNQGSGGADASGGTGAALLVPAVLFDRGVEYGTKFYLPDGRRWNGVTIDRVTGHPGTASTQIAAMEIHAERAWWIDRGSSSGRLRFSASGNADSWPAANFLDVNAGDGTFPAALWSYQNRLYIFKQKAIYVLETPGVPTTWILRKFMDIGCQPGSVVEYDGQLYWVAQQGAYRFNGSNIEKLSEPIQNVFNARRVDDIANTFNPIYSAIWRGLWVFGIQVEGALRTFCFNVDTSQWSEWVFTWQIYDPDTLAGRFPVSLFAEEYDAGLVGETRSGLYLTVRASTSLGQLLGTEVNYRIRITASSRDSGNVVTLTVSAGHGVVAGDVIRVNLPSDLSYTHGPHTVTSVTSTTIVYNQGSGGTDASGGTGTLTLAVNRHIDETGNRNVPAITEHEYNVKTETKYTYMGNAYDRKRVLDWMVEWEGGDVGLTQLDEVQRQISTTLRGNATEVGTVHQKRAKGLGYFRRISLNILVTNFRSVGFLLYGLHARVRSRGRQSSNASQDVSTV